MRNNHGLVSALVAGMLAMIPGTVAAQHVERQQAAAHQFADWLSAEIYTGFLSGQSNEFVYEDGRKVSELNWRIQGMGIAGGSIAVKPGDWLTLQLGGFVPFAAKNRMEDYDWLVAPYADWSHLSQHPDTRINHASMLDARLALHLGRFRHGHISVLGGYRRLNLSWTARGGSYVASSGGEFRNESGTFAPGERVISYEQWLEAPYVGLAAGFAHQQWSLEGELIGSLWGKGRALDDHHLRTIEFSDRADRMGMVGAAASVAYRLGPSLSATGRIAYQQFFEGRGPTRAYNYATDTTTHFTGEASGMDHRSLMVTVGLSARLP